MRWLTWRVWQKYGYCHKCQARAQEPCNNRFRVCKDRETYEHYCDRYATILTEAYGYPILPEQIPKIERMEMENHDDRKRRAF